MPIFIQTNLFVAILIAGLGFYAWRREKPMWFWSGTTVDPKSISDVRAYNHANAIMWWVYSLIFWTSVLVYSHNPFLSELIITFGVTIGFIPLYLAYFLIRRKYRVKDKAKE